jgi:predicted acylesterase/phospholipase RssA
VRRLSLTPRTTPFLVAHRALTCALLLLLFVVLPLRAQKSPDAKPFKRALVMTGGGFKFLYIVGMYDALVDRGWKPDLIITTCGASIAAAIIHGVPDRHARLALIQSPEMLAGIRGFRLTQGGFRDVERLVRKLSLYQRGWETGSDVVPDLFNLAFFEVDPITLPFWQRPFGERAPGAPHVIVTGSTANFTRGDVETPRNGRKLYHEAYFTDSVVAPYLAGYTSAVARDYPESSIGSEVRVFTDISVGDAAAISIRDPFLFPPVERNGQTFTGSNINLYPLELARSLADEVMMTFNPAFNGFELLAIDVSLGYDMNERLKTITGATVDYWIDATNMNVSQFAMDPKVHFGFPTLFQLKPNLPVNRPIQVAEGVTGGSPYVITAEADFMRRALVAYDRGYERGLEALDHQAPGTTAHVRGKNDRNYRGGGSGTQ